MLAELFLICWERHRVEPVTAHQLHENVLNVATPQDRTRQYLASFLARLAGTRMAGFVLVRQAPHAPDDPYALHKHWTLERRNRARLISVDVFVGRNTFYQMSPD